MSLEEQTTEQTSGEERELISRPSVFGVCGCEGQPRHSLSLFLSLCLSLRELPRGVTVGEDLEDKQHHTYTPNKTQHTHTHDRNTGEDSHQQRYTLTHKHVH